MKLPPLKHLLGLAVMTIGLVATLLGAKNLVQTRVTDNTPRPNASGDTFRVVKVVDGDTVQLSIYGQTKTIRLIGLDTPEVVDPRKPVQCFGREASAHAHQLLDGKSVTLLSDKLVGETDKYGRTLGYVFLPDGKNFAEDMIRDGYGHEYTYQSQAYKYQSIFRQAESEAQAANRGLWSPSTCSGDTTKAAA